MKTLSNTKSKYYKYTHKEYLYTHDISFWSGVGKTTIIIRKISKLATILKYN